MVVKNRKQWKEYCCVVAQCSQKVTRLKDICQQLQKPEFDCEELKCFHLTVLLTCWTASSVTIDANSCLLIQVLKIYVRTCERERRFRRGRIYNHLIDTYFFTFLLLVAQHDRKKDTIIYTECRTAERAKMSSVVTAGGNI